MTAIRTVGVVGTGVIGASWTGLFLARGLRVLVSDPDPGAEQKLAGHIKSIWPTLGKVGLSAGASPSNYEFVGASLGDRYGEVDFVQEVSAGSFTGGTGRRAFINFGIHRTRRRGQISRASSLPRLMPRRDLMLSLRPHLREFPVRNSSTIVQRIPIEC